MRVIPPGWNNGQWLSLSVWENCGVSPCGWWCPGFSSHNLYGWYLCIHLCPTWLICSDHNCWNQAWHRAPRGQIKTSSPGRAETEMLSVHAVFTLICSCLLWNCLALTKEMKKKKDGLPWGRRNTHTHIERERLLEKEKSLDSWDASSSWTQPRVFIIPPTFVRTNWFMSLQPRQSQCTCPEMRGFRLQDLCVRTDWLSPLWFPVLFFFILWDLMMKK